MYKSKACFREKGLSSVAGRNVKEVRPLEMKKTTFFVPDTVLNPFHSSSHLILRTAWFNRRFDPHWTKEEIEA